jgi:hypothetical protein
MMELWEPIKGYEGYYKISNFGRVVSLGRKIQNTSVYGGVAILKGKILKLGDNKRYKTATLCKEGRPKIYLVYHLVWDHFGDRERKGRKLQVDHIDNDKQNNHINNLQLLSQRDNLIKYHQTYNKLPSGIRYKSGKYEVSVYSDNKQNYLGRHPTLKEAEDILEDFFLDRDKISWQKELKEDFGG